MKSMFGSAAYTAELNNILSQIATSQTYQIGDINSVDYLIDTIDPVDPTSFGTVNSWVQTQFARIAVTDGLSIGMDNPTLLLFGQPGQIAKSMAGGDFRLDQNSNPAYEYIIDGAVITYGSDPEATERSALIMADALDRLVIRNFGLGGLVEVIESEGPPTPASTPAKAGGTYGGALVRWRAQVLRIV